MIKKKLFYNGNDIFHLLTVFYVVMYILKLVNILKWKCK